MRPQLLHCARLLPLARCRSVVGSDIRQPRHIPCSTLPVLYNGADRGPPRVAR
jgi:hypothetical protein